jgi:alkylation response protein AidB-like acyl-CoA dehydrogenase
VGQGAIDLAMDYAARRETMGEPLLAHQGLQFKLAGMEADVAAARALTFQAATFVDEGANEIQRLVIARQMARQLQDREPIWPEIMPGAPGVAVGAAAS